MPGATRSCARLGASALVWIVVAASGQVSAAGNAAETVAVNVAGVRLGTLLYSTAERDAMTRARQGDAESGAPLRTSRMTINGVVRRERGHSTAWLNGHPVADGQTLPIAGRVGVGRSGATLDGKAVRVGESLDVITRERTDVVAPGAVTVRGRK